MFSSRKNNFKPGFDAQFTLVALIMVFIMLIVFAKMYPIMEPYISDLVNALLADNYEMASLMISLVPFMIAVAIIMSVIYYIVPRRD